MESKMAAELTCDSKTCDNEDEAVRQSSRTESRNNFIMAIILNPAPTRANEILMVGLWVPVGTLDSRRFGRFPVRCRTLNRLALGIIRVCRQWYSPPRVTICHSWTFQG